MFERYCERVEKIHGSFGVYLSPEGFLHEKRKKQKRRIRFFHSQTCSMWTELYFHKLQIALTLSSFLTFFCGEAPWNEDTTAEENELAD